MDITSSPLTHLSTLSSTSSPANSPAYRNHNPLPPEPTTPTPVFRTFASPRTPRPRPHSYRCLPSLCLVPRAQTPPTPADLNEPSSDSNILFSSPLPSKQKDPVAHQEAKKNKAARKKANEQAILQAMEENRRAMACTQVLRDLQRLGYSFGDLVVYVSNPDNSEGYSRYTGFFSVSGRVHQVLSWWVLNPFVRQVVDEWVVDRMKRLVSQEGKVATDDGFLRTETMEIGPDFGEDFSLSSFKEKLTELCPKLVAVLYAFSTSSRQEKKPSKGIARRRDNVSKTSPLLFSFY